MTNRYYYYIIGNLSENEIACNPPELHAISLRFVMSLPIGVI